MPANRLHPADDEIQEALDGRLPAARRSEIEGHLGGCGECRGKWEILRWGKAQAGRAGLLDPPDDLAARIVRTLDEEDARRVGSEVPRRPWRFRGRPLWATAALAAVLLAVVSITLIMRRPDVPQAVARDYEAFRTGALALDVKTSDIQELEAHLAKARLPFPVRVLDLGMMRYRLVGGKVHDVGGRPTALVVYQGANGHTLLCEMHRGSLAELPASGEQHEHGGISFRVFQRGDVTLAFWPEGDVLCVLAGEGGPETILPLAFAKAMKAARRSAFSLLGAEDGSRQLARLGPGAGREASATLFSAFNAGNMGAPLKRVVETRQGSMGAWRPNRAAPRAFAFVASTARSRAGAVVTRESTSRRAT